MSSFFTAPPPPAAIEISGSRVTLVALSARGTERVVTGYASEPLPEGLVTPALNAVNVHDVDRLGAAIRAAAERVSPRPRRAALVLPDSVAKVSMLRFDKIPAKTADLEQLIRWQVRKSAPFRIEDAQVSWTDGAAAADGGREYFVLVARRDIVESYERACDAAGIHAGIIDIASPNLVNAVLATHSATAPGEARSSSGADASTNDWLLVHAVADATTLLVVRNGQLIFYRTRASDGTADAMEDLVHQTAMYHEDRLGGGRFGRVIVSGSGVHGESGERLRRQIGERLAARVEVLDVTTGITFRDRINAGADVADALAPALGVLLRERTAAARAAGERVA
jgi:Tfp pilus assembly PilM family ATPase